MKKYKQFILENRQYLTDPYDPEFELSYKLDIENYLKSVDDMMLTLADKLHINLIFPSLKHYGDSVIRVYRFHNDSTFTSSEFKLCYNNLTYKIEAEPNSYKTIEDVEKYLKYVFNLTNENKQYLTEPVDSDMELSIDITNQMKLVKSQIESLSNKYKFDYDFINPELLIMMDNISINFEWRFSEIKDELFLKFGSVYNANTDKLIDTNLKDKIIHTIRDFENIIKKFSK